MALDLGTLAAKLKLDDTEFQRGMRQAPQTAEKAGRQVGQNAERAAAPGLRNIGKLFAGLGIAKLTGDLLGFGLKTAMGNEKAEISFTTMLGSAKKAQAFLTKMKDFAATTPFEFPELQSAASSLISAGISANKVIPIMRTLGDVTSGMGTGSEGVKRATIALQQMNAAGKITGEDLNQLRDAGIPVFDLLAAATGRSKKEVAALAQQGKLGGKDLAAMMKALETGKGLERFNGLMGKQSQSLEGIISTLKDTVGQGLADALTPMIPSIKEGIGAFTAALPGILGGIKEFGGWVVKNQGWLKYLAIGLGVVAGAFLVLNAIMAVNPISLVVLAIAALVAGLLWAYDNVEWFRDGVNAAFEVIGGIATWLWNNALAPALRGIVQGFAWVVDGLAGMLEGLGNIPGFGWAKEAAGNLRNMAKQAREAAAGIKSIPDKKKIDLTISGTGKLDALARNFRALGINGARASGGPVLAGGTYLVGENGPELVKFGTSGQVYDSRRTQQALSAGIGSRMAATGASGASITHVQVDVHVPVSADPVSVGRAIDQALAKYKTGTGLSRFKFQEA